MSCCFEGLSHPCLPATFAYQTWSTTSSLDCWLSYPWFKSPISRLASLLTKMLCFFPTSSGESNLFLSILKEVPIINAGSVSSTPAVQPVVGSYLSYCNSTCMPNYLRGMRSLRRSLRSLGGQHISCLFSLWLHVCCQEHFWYRLSGFFSFGVHFLQITFFFFFNWMFTHLKKYCAHGIFQSAYIF